MPYGALGATVTGAPAGPLFVDDVGLADGEPADGELDGEADEVAAEPMPAGTEVAYVPSRTFTCPAGTELPAAAVTPLKDPAILAALASAPWPYSTWVAGWGAMLPVWPALKPADVSARDS
jgi:hypothetical protein